MLEGDLRWFNSKKKLLYIEQWKDNIRIGGKSIQKIKYDKCIDDKCIDKKNIDDKKKNKKIKRKEEEEEDDEEEEEEEE